MNGQLYTIRLCLLPFCASGVVCEIRGGFLPASCFYVIISTISMLSTYMVSISYSHGYPYPIFIDWRR